MKTKTKKIIAFSVLGAVLIALIVGLIIVLNTDNDNGDDKSNAVVPWEGEDVFGTKVLLAYPMFEIDQLSRVEIFSENGDFEFIKGWDEDKGDYAWQIKGCEDISLDLGMFEMMATWLSIATTKDPVRNATSEQLTDFGVDSSCKNGYAIYLKDANGKDVSYRIRIGNKVMSTSDTYYAYIEGRNHVYKLDNDIYTYTSYSKMKYLRPIINMFFQSNDAASTGVEQFAMYFTLDNNTTLSNILIANSIEEQGKKFNIQYSSDTVLSGIKSINASTEYVANVLQLLYTSFVGEEIVAIAPNEEVLKSFGLGSDDQKYFIDATFKSDATFADASYAKKDPSFYISKSIDGYHYVLSKYYKTDIIVKISADNMPFLKTDNFSLLKWADTTSIETGFFETLEKDDSRNAPGIYKLVLKTTNNEETFIMSYGTQMINGSAHTVLIVEAEKCGLVFTDNLLVDSTEKNMFRILYANLLYFPFGEDLNTRTDEEIQKIVEENEMVYSITAYRNDNVVVKYDYYKLSPNIAMECAMEGKVNADGTITYEQTKYDYVVTMDHVREVSGKIDALIAGEKISYPIS